MDFSKCTSLLGIALEILSNSSKSGIIKLPKSATYSLQDTLSVILHAATSATNSPESASNDLKLKKTPIKRYHHRCYHGKIVDWISESYRNMC
jgi:hypothetical protein